MTDRISLQRPGRRLTIQRESFLAGEWWKTDHSQPVVLEDSGSEHWSIGPNERLVIELLDAPAPEAVKPVEEPDSADEAPEATPGQDKAGGVAANGEQSGDPVDERNESAPGQGEAIGEATDGEQGGAAADEGAESAPAPSEATGEATAAEHSAAAAETSSAAAQKGDPA
jgi:hypothetical protein